MSEKYDAPAQDHGHLQARSAPTTQQIRTVGQRRREAEEKLEHHLEEARHKNEHGHDAETDSGRPAADKREVDGGDDATRTMTG